MSLRAKNILVASFVAFSFVFVGCSHARPPKPGPNFVWIPARTGPNGGVLPGYWKYAHPPRPHHKRWTPGHLNKRGVWIPGRWTLGT